VAAVVGQALLSVLYVSQAREVKRLREWAGGAPERAAPVTPPARRRAGGRVVAAAVAVAGLLVLGGVALLTGGGSRTRAPEPKRAAVKPAKVTVAVLNATTVPGLAARLRDEIAAAGFKKGSIDDFSDKQLPESVIQYAPGHQAEAKAVSRELGVSRREPVTAGTRALAGAATVIVIAGADKAS
jgi:hypothetical protein